MLHAHSSQFFFFFLLILLPPRSTLFPYTTLFRSSRRHLRDDLEDVPLVLPLRFVLGPDDVHRLEELVVPCPEGQRADRKSTRLNSSHPSISYAVFCLKKKKNII